MKGVVGILVAGWVLFLLYAYPGFESPDSVWQLAQARAGTYTNWHPPFMAFPWRYLDMIWAGTLPMLVVQTVAFLAGAYGILARALTPLRAAVVAVLVLLFPPVMTTLAPVWKDAVMAGFLLAGTAALLATRVRWRLAGCLLLFVATAVRHNALAATLPLVVLLFQWRWTGWRRYALAVGVWLAITASAALVNRALTSADQHPWHSSTALFDLAGVVRYAGETDDAALRDLLAGVPLVVHDDIAAKVRALYSPRGHHQLWHDDGRVFDEPTRAQTAAVTRAWLRAITRHPGAFLAHRLAVTRRLLGLTGIAAAPVFHDTIIPSRTPLQHGWVRALASLRDSFLFRPWMYLVFACALLAMCRARLPLALLASGLACEASIVLTAPSTDYRYSHWMIVTTVLAAILIFVDRYRGRTAC